MDRAAAGVVWAVYATVLVGGVHQVALGALDGVRAALLVAALGVAVALDTVQRRAVVAVLVARVAVFVVIIGLDASTTARALIVLVPFQVVLALGVRAGIVSAGLCVVAVVVVVGRAAPTWYLDAEASADVAMLVLGLVLAVSMAAVAVRERQARAALEVSVEQVARLAAAQERSRLARDVHDSLGHHLTATAIQLQKASAFRDLDPAASDAALAAAQTATQSALEEVRRSVRALRDDEATAGPGVAGLLALAAGTEDPVVTVDVAGDLDVQPAAVVSTLVRAAQEAVTNARRHADARHVRVRVDVTDDEVRLTVDDDGTGFDPDRATGGYGLVGLRERAQLVGGTVDVTSRPGSGTAVTVFVPTREPARR